MTPLRFLGLYGSAMVTFLALDLLWLGIVARGFYANQLGHLMRPDVRWGAAFLFYAIYVLGIVVLAVLPALDAGSLARAAGLGALLGLVAYAAYDLTNMATLAGFPAGGRGSRWAEERRVARPRDKAIRDSSNTVAPSDRSGLSCQPCLPAPLL
jgi:uncharacterized membrane protein